MEYQPKKNYKGSSCAATILPDRQERFLK